MRTTRLTLALGGATLLLASRLFATPPAQAAGLPGSHLTTKLVGYEILPAPEI